MMVADKKLKLAVFISGRGSNMQALVEACQAPEFPAEITLILSNRPEAAGITFAQEHNIATKIIDHKTYKGRKAFEEALLRALEPYDIDLICLAGFMRILTPHFIEHWPRKIINIHPSLLPDYKGLDTHERVIADQKTETGCTIHYVIPEMDEGEIILQKTVKILKDDTPDTLATRVLEQEHIAYPEAIRLMAEQ